jgi:hypothetical protein
VFQRIDYPYFLAGVIALAGFGFVPVIWGMLQGYSYAQALAPSLLSCAVFLVAFDTDGTFSLFRLLIGTFVAYMLAAGLSAEVNSSQPVFIAGGFLGFGAMMAGGQVGVFVGRKLRAIDPEDVHDCYGQLISRSQAAWGSGKFDSLSGEYRHDAESLSFEALSDKFYRYRSDIETANHLRTFDEDECMVEVGKGIFLLTNRALYTQKPKAVFLLEEIRGYKVIDRYVVLEAMSITLANDEVVVTGPASTSASRSKIWFAKAL